VPVQPLFEAEPISFLPKGWAGAVVLLVLLLVAGESVYTGTLTALESSKDLQWDEAKLLVDGIDPYSLFLDPAAPVPDYVNQGNLGLSQLPSSIVMFLPLAPLSFDTAKLVWIVVNLASTIVFVFLSCRLFLRGPVPALSLTALTLLLIAGVAVVACDRGQAGNFSRRRNGWHFLRSRVSRSRRKRLRIVRKDYSQLHGARLVPTGSTARRRSAGGILLGGLTTRTRAMS